MSEPILIDVLIVGGGAAGLFALHALRGAGASVLLVENNSLGFGQTTSSQGILNAGVKYSLGGLAGDDAKEAAEAAHQWIQLLDGANADLRNVRVLTRQCYLWRTSTLLGAAGMLGAKLALKTKPKAIASIDRPSWLDGVGGEVLTLGETVIDPRSLLRELSTPHAHAMLKGNVTSITPRTSDVDVEIESSRRVRVRARHVILTAGIGNQEMVGLSHTPNASMQQRPLRQAMIRGALPLVFGHCIDGAKTRITVTSDVFTAPDDVKNAGHASAANDVVWHVGGQIAEDGPRMGDREFLEYATGEICRCIPGVSLKECGFASYDVTRAEPRTGDGKRPPTGFCRTQDRITTIWPVKLVLAPKIAAQLVKDMEPSTHPQITLPMDLPRPELAPRPWETARWSALV